MSHASEARFWDHQARALDLNALRREAGFVAAEPLWRWALEAVAARRPGRILDLGCGRGATTLLLAGSDAAPDTVGVDVSLGALAAARALAQGGPRAPAFAAATLEELPFADATFDLVAGRFVLHHASALGQAAAEIARVLRPGGSAVFVETWGRNPGLRLGRDIAGLFGVGMGTEDERPLGEEELACLAAHFHVERHFPTFTACELSNRLWRRLKPLARRSPRFRDRLARVWAGSLAVDRWVERRLPMLKPWGWFVGLVLEKRR